MVFNSGLGIALQILDIVCRDDMQSDQKKLENAIKDVLKTALVHDGLARGLKEAVKALDR